MLTFFLEYSRIWDGWLRTLSCEIYHTECGYYCDKNSSSLVLFGHAWDMPNIFVGLSKNILGNLML